MAVKRVLTIKLFYAQARRVDCEHCGAPYTWIDGGVETGEAEAGITFADDNELRREAFRKAADPLVERAEREQVGRGRCPHCHRLQTWMLVTPGVAMIGSLVAAVIGAAVIGLITYALSSTTTALYVGGGAAAVGVLLALVFGRRLADEPGPQPEEKDERVKTDEQLLRWFNTCLAKDLDPVLGWWEGIGHEAPSKSADVSLGLLDHGKAPLEVAEGLTTVARARDLSAMDA